MDALLQFYYQVALTTQGSYKGDSVALRQVGNIKEEYAGEPMEVVCQVTEDFASGGASTLDFRFSSANDQGLTTPVTQASSGALALAVLKKGKTVKFALDFPTADADATHFGVVIVIATASMTAGKISCWIQRTAEGQHTIND